MKPAWKFRFRFKGWREVLSDEYVYAIRDWQPTRIPFLFYTDGWDY